MIITETRIINIWLCIFLIALAFAGCMEKTKSKNEPEGKEYIEMEIDQKAGEMGVCEELYRVAYLLFIKGQLNDSDQLLRHIVNKYGDEDKYIYAHWVTRAMLLLMSDKFQEFYSKNSVSNTFFFTDVPDGRLFDKESVRRKYGEPQEVTSIEKTDFGRSGQLWIYEKGTNKNGRLEFTFIGNALLKKDSCTYFRPMGVLTRGHSGI